MKTSFLAAIVSALLICGTAMADTDAQDVLWFADETPTGGTSYMTRSDTLILETLEATGLVSGDATTLWWVVFNNPAGCSDAICGDDEFNPGNDAMLVAAQVAVGNATGNVVRSDGTLEYGAKLTMGWNDPSHEVDGSQETDRVALSGRGSPSVSGVPTWRACAARETRCSAAERRARHRIDGVVPRKAKG